eukprot:TRINITY_DN7683_c0_g1_i1.p1 TRINITY_DN7683_c0_g1~~TRINITY_DN7683_c0_g1_i1.p1  ORF type:complete len:173 (+),score=39.15 TRINITY_DN7683_c0_g1_i1:674-1192(+)
MQLKDLSQRFGFPVSFANFARLDKDKSGNLDFADMLRVIYSGITLRDVNRAVKRWGLPFTEEEKVEEVVQDWRAAYTKEQAEEIETIFRMYHGSPNGKMTKAELRKHIAELDLPDSLFEEMFAQADGDNDGALSLEDFADIMKDLYIDYEKFRHRNVVLYFNKHAAKMTTAT